MLHSQEKQLGELFTQCALFISSPLFLSPNPVVLPTRNSTPLKFYLISYKLALKVYLVSSFLKIMLLLCRFNMSQCFTTKITFLLQISGSNCCRYQLQHKNTNIFSCYREGLVCLRPSCKCKKSQATRNDMHVYFVSVDYLFCVRRIKLEIRLNV